VSADPDAGRRLEREALAFRAALDAHGSGGPPRPPAAVPGHPCAALVDVACLCCSTSGQAVIRVRAVLMDPASWVATFDAEAERLEVDPGSVQRRDGVTWGQFHEQGSSVPLMAGQYRGAGGVHRVLMLVLTRAV
jgi:hypothetical protein